MKEDAGWTEKSEHQTVGKTPSGCCANPKAPKGTSHFCLISEYPMLLQAAFLGIAGTGWVRPVWVKLLPNRSYIQPWEKEGDARPSKPSPECLRPQAAEPDSQNSASSTAMEQAAGARTTKLLQRVSVSCTRGAPGRSVTGIFCL